MKLSQLADQLQVRIENGAPDTEITAVAGIEDAQPGHITFVANPKYAAAARTTRASAVIVSDDFPAIPPPVLRAKNSYYTFARALELFYQPPANTPGIHPTDVVHPTARIGERAHLGPYVVIDEEVRIGDDAILLAHAVVYRNARIGNRFLAHAHSVVREHCQIGERAGLVRHHFRASFHAAPSRSIQPEVGSQK